ncbi:MAG: hypothetical protein EOO09_20770 [Chitinophagaceae bacterium]|nr:MAG: hypothetical protein EOO09_20770 [Chitinophagaceae bacterium]
MNSRSLILISLRFLLATLIVAWLLAIGKHPIHLEPDSYGYVQDASNLFVPGYLSQRPPLYPLWLLAFGSGSAGLGILCFLVNAGSLFNFIKMVSGKGWKGFFSLRNSLVLVFFFLLSSIWSYCATVLTESILFAVELWIFIWMVRIFQPAKPWRPVLTIVYALLISALAITLKPWIMVFVLLVSVVLLLASLLVKSFRPHSRAALLTFVVFLIAFSSSYSYSKSKSFESANAVVLMISTPGEIADLRKNADASTMDSSSASLANDVLSDIQLINTQFGGNPWQASESGRLLRLNILKKEYAPGIRKAFQLMYFNDWRNTLGLATTALHRYFIQLKAGLSTLDMTYGPRIRLIRSVDFPFIFIVLAICGFYYRKHRHPRNPGTVDHTVLVFSTVIFFAALLFAISLTLAGTDLQRVVYTAIPFQLFALVYFVFRFRRPRQGD